MSRLTVFRISTASPTLLLRKPEPYNLARYNPGQEHYLTKQKLHKQKISGQDCEIQAEGLAKSGNGWVSRSSEGVDYKMTYLRFRRAGQLAGAMIVAVCGAAVLNMPAQAVEFSYGEISGVFDTTLTTGISIRASDRDDRLIAVGNGGTGQNTSIDEGNLNYDQWDVTSTTIKASNDLLLTWENTRLFLRGSYFYDYINNQTRLDQGYRLGSQQRSEVGKEAQLLDAFFAINLDVAEKPLEFRLGKQVLSWGESTFIPNGLNVINPIDISRFRQPGSQLKEALVPVFLASASIDVTPDLSAEIFYQLKWEEFKLDPQGTLFGNDTIGRGTPFLDGERLIGTSGLISSVPENAPQGIGFDIPHESDQLARDDGQWGVALRYYAADLNGTEFGLFFLNYHSRLPLFSIRAGNDDDSIGLGTAAAGVLADPNSRQSRMLAALADPAVFGIDCATVNAGSVDPFANSGLCNLPFLSDIGTMHYRLEYPEDIKKFGASFNTYLSQGGGIALQGEVSYTKDQPLQINSSEVFLAGFDGGGVSSEFGITGTTNAATGNVGTQGSGAFDGQLSQIRNNGENAIISGFERFDVVQLQTTATKVWGPNKFVSGVMQADQLLLIAEVGGMRVRNMPDSGTLALAGPATTRFADRTIIGGGFDGQTMAAAFDTFAGPFNPVLNTAEVNKLASRFSWGYSALAVFDYNDAFAGINLQSKIALQHDVQGNSPAPIANWVEDRKSITLALAGKYIGKWQSELSYTNFFGAGEENLINDRDFISFNVSYSF